MKVLAKYVAKKTIKFAKECVEQNALTVQVQNIMKKITPIPKNDENCEFANGYYFIQQDLINFNKVKHKILMLIKVYVNHQWVDDTLNKKNTHFSYVAKLLDKHSNIKPLHKAWCRISNTDKLGREWGQSYFAENPEKSPALQMSLKITDNN